METSYLLRNGLLCLFEILSAILFLPNFAANWDLNFKKRKLLDDYDVGFMQAKRTKKAGIVGKYGRFYTIS